MKNDVLQAKERTEKVEESLRNELTQFDMQIEVLQARLSRSVQSGAPREEIADLTRRIRMLQTSKRNKQNILSNIYKERQQLTDANVNVSVTEAMKESLEAQQLLANVICDDDPEAIDSMLDNVEEHRQDTRDLSERLGSLGVYEDIDVLDEEVDDEMVMQVLGWSTDKSDRKLADGVRKRIAVATNQSLEANDVSPQSLANESCNTANCATPQPQTTSQTEDLSPMSMSDFPQVPVTIRPRVAVSHERRDGWNF